MIKDEKWEQSLLGLPIESCGRLDMHSFLPDPQTVGRVTSDQVRYVYFENGEEVIVIGKNCDEVAYAAMRYSQELKNGNPTLR